MKYYRQAHVGTRHWLLGGMLHKVFTPEGSLILADVLKVTSPRVLEVTSPGWSLSEWFYAGGPKARIEGYLSVAKIMSLASSSPSPPSSSPSSSSSSTFYFFFSNFFIFFNNFSIV